MVNTFCRVAALVLSLICTTLFNPAHRQAAAAGPLALKTAVEQTDLTEQVSYICRRGPYGRDCYYVSQPKRNRSYNPSYHYRVKRSYDLPGFTYDDLKYNYHHWGGGDGPQ